MKNNNPRLCPHCKTELKEGDALHFCANCGTAYHETCWQQNGGCSAESCIAHTETEAEEPKQAEPQPTEPLAPPTAQIMQQQDPPAQQQEAPMAEYVAPQNPLQTATATAVAAAPAFCSICGNMLRPGQNFCATCGQTTNTAPAPAFSPPPFSVNEKPKKKKTPLIIALIAAVLVLFSITGIVTFAFVEQKKQEEARADYLIIAKVFLDEVSSAGETMEDIGNTIQSYWHTYIYNNGTYYKKFSSVDDAVESAQLSQAASISTVKAGKSTIEAKYALLQTLPKKSEDFDVIKAAVKDTYDAYIDMYDCVIDVSGNYSNYTEDFGDTDSEIAKQVKTLYNLMEAASIKKD